MGKPKHVEDDLMMTIASDEELSNVEDSSDEEVDEEEMKDAIISKVRKTVHGKQLQEEEKAKKKESVIAEGFEFDADGFAGPTGSSWDFTKAISRIEKMEAGMHQGTQRTTIQTKIAKLRKEKEAAKLAKKEKKALKAAKKEKSNDKGDGDESGDDKDAESGDSDAPEKAGSDDEEEDEESSNDEEEQPGYEHQADDDAEEDVVEEERLQSALMAGKKDLKSREELVDEIEKQRAAEFFDVDPYAAEEFAKSKFETFADLKLSRPIMRAITQIGFEKPTPIQQRAIPIALTGKDICASAQTGSGKTAAFLLPILERLQFRSRRVQSTRVLIICPVRELATQCQSMLEQLSRFTDITCALAVGGLPLKAQEVELRNRPDVVICTPGRMIDHLRNSKSIHMDDLEILVLDEADRLLELGFTEEVLELVRMCPIARQTMLFSATLTSKVDQLISLSMKRPVRISTDPLFDMAKHLVQEFVRIRPNREDDREAILLALCTRTFRTNTIVFMETKVHAHRMMIIFGLAGIKAAELHGNLQQKDRLEALQNFRDGTVDILLCTDVAARGIDVKGVHAVINYEMPKDITTYVHRVGRTARAGRNGRAVTLTSESRRLLMKQVSRHCHGFVKSRAVPDPVIAQWKTRIESMQSDIKLIMHEETLEKRMREAEKEAMKASNMVRYQDEIASRPARTWFMSEKEKKRVAENAEEDRLERQGVNKDGDADTEMSRAKKLKLMSHKKRRLFEIREREEHALADARAEDSDENAGGSKKSKKVFAAVHVAAAAKHAKKANQLAAKEREEESISEMHERKRLKREKARAAKSSHAGPKSAFDVDMGGNDAPKPKAQRSAPQEKNPFEFKEKITNFKKHAKKTSSSFKSKSKYKRRK
ncbi:Dead/deah box RNA helicase, partial [Globisporangium splendens]